MKKKIFNYSLLLMFIFTTFIGKVNADESKIVYIASAGTASDVETTGSSSNCTKDCVYLADSKQWWKSTGGGVRYTFVDKNGDLATNYGFDKSYNYKTKINANTFYNDYKGDSSKKSVLTGDGMSIKKDNNKWPTHQSLISKYNEAVNSHGSYIASLVGTAPDSITYAVESQNNGWKGYGSYDYKFFNFFKDTSDQKRFLARFLTLIYAIKESSGEKMDDEIIKEIAGKACKDDIDLYLIAEPMMGFSIGSYQKDTSAIRKFCEEQYPGSRQAQDECYKEKSKGTGYVYKTNLRVVGTLADLGKMMYKDLDGQGLLNGSIGAGTYKNTSKVYMGPGNGYANKGQVAWIDSEHSTIYNTRAIPWFGLTHGFERPLSSVFYYQPNQTLLNYGSYGSFTSDSFLKSGQGMWGLTIALESETCNPIECDYIDNTLTSNDPVGTWKELPSGTNFKNLAEFAFAPKKDGGLDCCYTLKDDLASGELKDKAEWKAAYQKYCEVSTCEVIDENTIAGPNNTQYTKDNYPKSGFEDFGDFVTDDKKRGGLDCCDTIKGKGGKWDEYYDKYCDNNDKDCCTENPIPPATTYNGDLHNCCLDDDVSVIQQTNVTDLFCYNDGKKVSDYFPKCNADTYLEKNINEYCNLYCSERLMIKQPRPITATTGRYFSFPEIETDVGVKTTAPYLRAYKRCSVTTAWDEWINAYTAKVNEAIAAYNNFQKLNAYADLFNNAKVIKVDVKATGRCSNTCNNGKDASPSTDSYEIYDFSALTSKKYYGLKINDSKKNSYEALELIYNPDASGEQTHAQYTTSGVKSPTPSCSGSETCGEGVDRKSHDYHLIDSSVSRTYTYNGSSSSSAPGSSYEVENFANAKADANQKAQQANNAYKTAKAAMKSLEDKLNQCEGYFSGSSSTLPDGSDITVDNQKIYNLDPKLDFNYTQVVLNENGKKVSDKIQIEFEPRNTEKKQACEFSGPIIASDNGSLLSSIGYTPKGAGEYVTSDGELKTAAYSSIYSGSGNSKYYETMKLFNVSELTKTADRADEFVVSEADAYKAQKKFNEFAKYKADCIWIDKGTTTTLYPSGLVANTLSTKGLDETTTYKNYTKHDREYSISTRVLTGTYQTNWNMTGLGENGKFDKYIQEKGTACSMDPGISSYNPSDKEDNWRFTCAIKITNYTATTGKCEPSSVVAPVDKKNMEPCDPADVVQPTLTFKIVDGKDLFPNTTKGENGFTDNKNNTYGYNWVTKEGSEAYDKITLDANQDALFSPDHLAESIKLDSGSIRLIKLYNSKTSGGYSDFNLVCQCEEELKSTLPDNKLPEDVRAGCTKCKSVFLENLQNGTIMIDGKSETINVWAGKDNLTLDKIRSERLGW